MLRGFFLLFIIKLERKETSEGKNVKGSQTLMFLEILNLFQMVGDNKNTKCILSKN